jgi:hypothetical protein
MFLAQLARVAPQLRGFDPWIEALRRPERALIVDVCQSASKKDPVSASKKDPPFGMSLRGVTGFSGRWLIYRMSPACSCARLSRVTRHRIGTGSLLAPAEPLAFAVPEIQNLLMVVAAVELWAKVDAVGNAKRCPRQGDRCAQRIVHKSTAGAGPRRWACARDRVRPGS